jgi:hypothetical protein
MTSSYPLFLSLLRNSKTDIVYVSPPVSSPWKVASFRRKSVQMLATLMATATYAAGFNPPGGVWQDSAGAGAGAGHLPGSQ